MNRNRNLRGLTLMAGFLWLTACATTQTKSARVTGASPAAAPQVLRAGGLELTVDLTDWKQELGPGRLRGNYYRLGLFSGQRDHRGQVLSILIDDLPKSVVDLDGLCRHNERSYSQKTPVEVLEHDRAAGQPACLLAFTTQHGDLGSRREVYAEMLAAGRWIELHWSAVETPGATRQGQAALRAILASLSARRSAGRPDDVAAADVTDNELRLVANRLGCEAKPRVLFCAALEAFAHGKRPSGRPEEVALVGVSAIVPAPGSTLDGQPIAYEVSYLILSDRGAKYGTIRPENEAEQRANDEVARAIGKGERLPADNATVKYVRSQRGARAVFQAEQSLVWEGDTKGFVRDTALGIVVLEYVPGGALLGFFPPQ